MRKRKASHVLSISDGRTGDDEKSGIKSEGTSEESEEPTEEASEESLSQSSSDRDNDDTEQRNGEQSKEPTEEPSEESVSQPLADRDNDETDRETEELSEEPDEEPSEKSVCQPSSDSDTEHQSEPVLINSNEKKRALATTACESGPLQVYQSSKKFKQEHSLKPESDVGSAVTDLQSKSGISKPESFVNDDNASEQQEERTGSSGKRRRSRWDSQPEGDGEAGEDNRTTKRRKTRWAVDDSQLKMLGPIQLPDFMKEFVVGSDFDPEIQDLNIKLLAINRKLLGSEVHDDRTEEERSPSPQPVYNNLGIRINSRDVRFREKLIQDRQHIISRLIQKNPTFKPPPDYKPSKLYKKIYIPLKEYPGYNFVGLILGPRGNTQKRMQKETGARIVIRGKGSAKEGRSQQKLDPSDNEDLHVLVESDSQKSLDAAVGMVEKILIPVDERMNTHKLAQLKELAELKGTLRDENLCKVCGEHGHMHYSCPILKTTFKIDVSCDTCGGNSHSTANCPLTASAPGSDVDFQCHNFLTDLGGGGDLTFGTFPTSSSKPQGFSNSGLGTSSSYTSCSLGLGSTPNTQSNKEVNYAKLFVGNLPQTVDDGRLRELFSPFGRLTEATVIKKGTTGFGKSFGFVIYDDPISASTAVAHMNGYNIDGKMLAVKVAGHPPTAGNSIIALLPKYPGSAVVSQYSTSQIAWPGPPGSMLPVPQASFRKNEDFGLPPSSIFLGYSDSFPKSKSLDLPPSSIFLGHSDSVSQHLPSSYELSCQFPISSPSSLANFPGNPNYLRSQYQSYFTPPTSNPAPQLHLTNPLGSSLTPLPWERTHLPGRDTKVVESEYGNLRTNSGPFHCS